MAAVTPEQALTCALAGLTTPSGRHLKTGAFTVDAECNVSITACVFCNNEEPINEFVVGKACYTTLFDDPATANEVSSFLKNVQQKVQELTLEFFHDSEATHAKLEELEFDAYVENLEKRVTEITHSLNEAVNRIKTGRVSPMPPMAAAVVDPEPETDKARVLSVTSTIWWKSLPEKYRPKTKAEAEAFKKVFRAFSETEPVANALKLLALGSRSLGVLNLDSSSSGSGGYSSDTPLVVPKPTPISSSSSTSSPPENGDNA